MGGSRYIYISTRRLVTGVTWPDLETQSSVSKSPPERTVPWGQPVSQQDRGAAQPVSSLRLTKQNEAKPDSFRVLTGPFFFWLQDLKLVVSTSWCLCLHAAWHMPGVKPQRHQPHQTLRRSGQGGCRDYSFNTYFNSYSLPGTVPGTGSSRINKQG